MFQLWEIGSASHAKKIPQFVALEDNIKEKDWSRKMMHGAAKGPFKSWGWDWGEWIWK